jgi:hypothetical protein
MINAKLCKTQNMVIQNPIKGGELQDSKDLEKIQDNNHSQNHKTLRILKNPLIFSKFLKIK